MKSNVTDACYVNSKPSMILWGGGGAAYYLGGEKQDEKQPITSKLRFLNRVNIISGPQRTV